MSAENSGNGAFGRFSRENYERELAATREVLARPIDSMPSTELELAELKRLIVRYPEQARQFVAELPPRPRAG